jgi:hypothetical protein
VATAIAALGAASGIDLLRWLSSAATTAAVRAGTAAAVHSAAANDDMHHDNDDRSVGRLLDHNLLLMPASRRTAAARARLPSPASYRGVGPARSGHERAAALRGYERPPGGGGSRRVSA